MSEGLHEALSEGLYYGSIICDTCNTEVDLDDADTVNEAGELWNEHMRDEHPGVFDGEVADA